MQLRQRRAPVFDVEAVRKTVDVEWIKYGRWWDADKDFCFDDGKQPMRFSTVTSFVYAEVISHMKKKRLSFLYLSKK